VVPHAPRPARTLAFAAKAGLGALVVGMTLPPTRFVLDRILPKPGSGPGERGPAHRFTVDIFTVTSTGARYTARVGAKGNPGYAATAVMLGESALALALDTDRLPDRAGSLTPATALGDVLVERLRAAGHTYEVTAA
jgi:short subunit dehydrogenase-like uncharacterized protein